MGEVADEIRETCKENKERFPVVGLEHLVSEEITLSKWEEPGDNSFSKLFKRGNVLFGRRRAYLKKAVMAPFDGICSGDITVIEARPDRILPELLPFVIQNDRLFEYAVGKSAGSLSPRVKWEYLREYEFELPDIAEQRKLTEVLWAIQEARDAYKKLIAATDELVKAQFVEMFGDPWANPKYLMVPIDELGEVMTGTTPSMKKQEYYESDDICFIKPSDLAENCVSIVTRSESYISEKARMVGRIFPEKSVLVTCIGTIGKVGITTAESSCNQQINVIVPNNFVNYCYLAHCLLYIRDQMKEMANAPVVPILNKGDFSAIKLPLPPLHQQEQFADFVQQTDKSKQELEQTLSELTVTYKKILADRLG